MYAGKIAEEADTEELFTRMRHPYAEALLSSVPKLDQSPDERLLSIPGLPPDLSTDITNCRFAPRCPYATEQCREEDPPLEASDPTLERLPPVRLLPPGQPEADGGPPRGPPGHRPPQWKPGPR